MEAFETRGRWWLPGENPENATVGVLTFDPHGHTELNLYGSFSLKPREMPIVLGKSDNGQDFTLVNCITASTMHYGNTGYNWKYSTYRFEVILQNRHFERKEEIVFKLLRIKYAGLENWASTKFLLSEIYANHEWKISVDEFFRTWPDTSHVSHSATATLEDFKVSIRCRHTRVDDIFRSSPYEQDTDIQFVPTEHWGIDETLSNIFQMKIFLSLAMGTSTWPVSVEAFDVEANHSPGSTKTISVLYNPRTKFIDQYRMKEQFMYFTLEIQRYNMAECLRKWFEIYKELEQVLDLYNRCISNVLVYEDSFLIYAKAVEVYHRQMHDETYVDEDAFAELYAMLISHIPRGTDRDLKNRIENSLKWANRPSFGGRLRRIGKKHKNHSENLFVNYERFIRRVTGTRNYLTHFGEAEGQEVCTDAKSLHTMGERLRCILELCLLSELGFDDSDLHEMASGFSRKLPRPRIPKSSLSNGDS